MSTKPRNSESAFLQAARAFDEELASYHRVVDATLRCPVNGAKQLERAGQLVTEIAQAEERLGAASKILSLAIASAQELQVSGAEKITERAQVIAVRSAELELLMDGYRALGQAASILNTELVELTLKIRDHGEKPINTSLSTEIELASDKLSSVASSAHLLMDTARAKDFEDIARQVDSLRQQLLSARNKLLLVSRQTLS